MINSSKASIFIHLDILKKYKQKMTEMRGGCCAGAWIKFRLLMWKNFLQQWRHRLQTLIELFLPVITMALVLLLRWQVEPSQEPMRTYPPIPAYGLNLSKDVLVGMNVSQLSIAYSPTSAVLEDVVLSAVIKIVIENQDLIPGVIEMLEENFPNFPAIPPDLISQLTPQIINLVIRNLTTVHAFNNSDQLRGLYGKEETTRIVLAAVEFDDQLYGATQLPTMDLSYALRFPSRPRLNSFYQRGARNWRTHRVFPNFESPGPRFPFSYEGGNDPGYVNEIFIALQHAISIELVSRVTGQDLSSFRVKLQRYPHPPYLEDLAVDLLQLMFPMFIMLSFSYTAVNIVRAVTIEKELQLKETMKIMGLPTWLHWTAWFCKQFLFQLVSAVLITILLKVNWFTNEDGFNEYAVFTNTPWTVLFFYLTLYLSCMIFFCFMISGLFSKGSSAALFTGIFWFLTYIPAFLLSMDIQMSTTGQILSCLSINTAMSFGFQLMLARESLGGMHWSDFMASPATESTEFVFGHVVIMLVANCVLYMLITLYLEQVAPGPFGSPRPWYFPLQARFWCPGGKSATDIILSNAKNYDDDIIKEKDPKRHSIGVKMQNLTKVYGNQIAVNHLSLNIFDDQITVLLGHNGAGKSTTISMLTGNLEASHGIVEVAGYDMSTQTEAARSHIGLCPQHNVIFHDLTVREHLEFFARLKGFTGANLTKDVETLIEKLELQEKRDCRSKALSGGQKRRLCVGIALSGGAKVVLLDEPTSGMDPASRRGLWDLLQREKKGRSMILTTHFMDEADILGDRVAIMAHGKLQCVGSPYFLKRHYGVGYTLVVVKDDDFDQNKCTELINDYIPGTIVKEDRGSEITYSLLNDLSHKFEDMLNDLERNARIIKYKNYGLIATTLEDVFMSVGADLALVNSNSDSDDAATTITDSTTDDVSRNEIDSSLEQLDKHDSSVTGFTLLGQRVLAVWLKLLLVWSRSYWLLILQFAAPIVLINATLGVLQYVMSRTATIQNRILSLTDGFVKTETLLSYNGTSASGLGALAAAAYQKMFEAYDRDDMAITNIGEQPMDVYYLNRTWDPVDMGTLRNQLLIGSTFTDDSATAWFSNFGHHDVAMSLAAVHTALLKMWNPNASLIVSNHPLEASYSDQTDMRLMISMISMQLSSGIGSSIAIVSAVYIMFYIKERISGAKLLQKAAGVQPLILWGSAAVFDWIWFLIICISIVVSCVAFGVVGFSTAAELGRLYVCVMVYGAAMLPLTYILSHVFNRPAIGFVSCFFLNVVLGMMGAQIVESLMSPVVDTKYIAEVFDSVLQIFPLYSFITALRYLNQIGLRVHTCLQMCEYLQAVLPNFECTMESLCERQDDCCVQKNPFFLWEEPGVLRYLVAMICMCIVFWIILMIIEYRLVQKVWNFKKTPPLIDERTLDQDVAAEAQRARQVYMSNHSNQALLATGLSKYYRKHLAVDQISFSVSDGECFGLLGVNGAGKTSTFKMLMGDEAISSGEAFVSGHSVQRNLNKVHQNIGYCPQFDALFLELTGRETLRVFGLMRGLRMSSIWHISEVFAHSLGFYKHLDKRVHQYSGGTKRKLNTAVAFLGKTRLVFVDEPTTGVDPAAKRHVWRAVRGVQRAGRGVVLTSHSMEECEALCSRLTIMVNGRFQCLGTPQHLKNKFSEGFTLTIKLKTDEAERSANTLTRQSSIVSASASVVKDYVNLNFRNPKIMEEYQGFLTYYLPDRSIAWSRMFGIMERAKRELEIEDYTIKQTTLEQIFLQFTKYQGHREVQATETLISM
ncbi:unnamed protein product [Arctia plantaginis]|uniref:ABC transporter domain-containing protein n=1 Tax=Arctia plantaginis TaxID=874455 RepID=A0A8S0YX02_ARCPL|nr:unnamed protein product [Arctia plantaginis]